MSQEQVSINVSLGGRTYRMKVSLKDEAHIRASLNEIQKTYAELKQQFPGRDEQDYLAMTLINFVSDGFHGIANAQTDNETVLHRLQKINELLG